jgi:hypothetical protein
MDRTHMAEKRNAYSVLVANVKEKDHLEDPGTEGRIKLKCILNTVGRSELD